MTHERSRCRFAPEASEARDCYIDLRVTQPHFANSRSIARSIRNALDRARLRQASRLFAERDRILDAEALTTIEASDLLASRVFQSDG